MYKQAFFPYWHAIRTPPSVCHIDASSELCALMHSQYMLTRMPLEAASHVPFQDTWGKLFQRPCCKLLLKFLLCGLKLVLDLSSQPLHFLFTLKKQQLYFNLEYCSTVLLFLGAHRQWVSSAVWQHWVSHQQKERSSCFNGVFW